MIRPLRRRIFVESAEYTAKEHTLGDLKTYELNGNGSQDQSFGIGRMEDTYEKRTGQADSPHRHNFYTVILIQKAKGFHRIDFEEYELADNQIYFISPGQVHQITEQEKPKGFAITFSNSFLAQNNIPVRFIENLKLFQVFGQSPPLLLEEEELDKLLAYVEEMYQIFNSDLNLKTEAIGALLMLMLIQCNNACSLPERDTQSMEAGNAIIAQFKKLLEENYSHWHSARQYATQLHITPDHLGKVLKSLTGRSTKEHIQGRITTAAKRMLYFSDLSTKEIAYKLGFSEPANFSAFFKKCTGKSPSEFRPAAK